MKNSLDTMCPGSRACSCQTGAMAGRQQSQGGHAAGASELGGLMQADTAQPHLRLGSVSHGQSSGTAQQTLASETRPVQWASGACGLRHHFPTIYGAYRIIAQSLLEKLLGNHQLQKPMYPAQAACQSSEEERQQPASALHRGTKLCCSSLWRQSRVAQMLRLKCAYASLLVPARGYDQRRGSLNACMPVVPQRPEARSVQTPCRRAAPGAGWHAGLQEKARQAP